MDGEQQGMLARKTVDPPRIPKTMYLYFVEVPVLQFNLPHSFTGNTSPGMVFCIFIG